MSQIYAALGVNGEPMELPAHEEFATFADGESVNHPAGALQLYGPDDLARYGIQAVEVEDAPAGQVRMGYSLAVIGGAISAAAYFAPAPAPPLPDEVPMWKVRGWLAREGRLDLVRAAISSLPNAGEAMEVFNSAPNLVVEGDIAQLVKAALAYDDEEYAAAIRSIAAYAA